MKVTIQTLANKKYPVEIDEKDTVLALKQKIQNELNLGDVEEQKLIHLGKILKNEQSIESATIKAGAMIVLMQSKIKKPAAAAPSATEAGPSSTPATAAAATPAPAAAASTPAPATASADAPMTPATQAQPSAATAAATPSTPATTTGSTATTTTTAAGAGTTTATATAAASTLGMGANLEPMITDLMALGFPRDQVQAALRASFNNPDRAADYLFNGIPEHVMRDMNRPSQAQSTTSPSGAAAAAATGQQAGQGGAATPTPAQQQSPAAGAGAGGAPGGSALAQLMANAAAQQQQPAGGDISADNPLAGLAANPQFAAMRMMLQQNPHLIPPLLQQLAQSDPQLAQLIQQNPEALAELLAGGGGAGGPQPGRGQQVIQITLEEKAQLDALESLGFSRQRALEAWLLCDRNADLASNYLLEHGFDEEIEDAPSGGQGQGGAGGFSE